MKKLIALAILSLSTFAFATACTSNDDEENTTTQTTTAMTTTTTTSMTTTTTPVTTTSSLEDEVETKMSEAEDRMRDMMR